jgi:eukaryotic-like serine/threonine-protein kinase
MAERWPDLGVLEGATIDGRYVLSEFVGQGAFGGVFASQQQLLGIPVRRVAIKVSKRMDIELDLARQLFADAFVLAEAMDQILDSEARRHLVHVYDIGIAVEHGRRAYVVMEYVEGRTLGVEMRAYRTVPPGLMVRWVREACCALAGLHRLDPPLLHRDVKPDNLLIGSDGIRLVDFGLAARMHGRGLMAGAAGTTSYMAPEAADGVSIPASDVYSLGVVLYEGLTGELPFPDAPFDTPKALLAEAFQEQRRVLPEAPRASRGAPLSRALGELVLACLDPDPRNRPQDAGALLEALRELKRGDATESVASVLERARGLRLAGDLEGARVTIEHGLTRDGRDPETELGLVRELGAVFVASGDDEAAVQRLLEAWSLVKDSTLLRSRAERAALLREISRCYARLGNAYQAARYARMADAEERGEPYA